jgi:hypothetical protein
MGVRKFTPLGGEVLGQVVIGDISSGAEAAGKVPTSDGAGGAIWQTPPGSALVHTHCIFVAKVGNDASAGTQAIAPKLTIASAITAASALISGGAR